MAILAWQINKTRGVPNTSQISGVNNRVGLVQSNPSPVVTSRPIFDITTSSDGRFVAVARRHKSVLLWQLNDQQKYTFLGDLPTYENVDCVTFSKINKNTMRLFAGNQQTCVEIWEIRDGKRHKIGCVSLKDKLTPGITSLTCSDDERFVFVGSLGGQILKFRSDITDLQNPAVMTIVNSGGSVFDISLAKSDNYVVVGYGYDGTAGVHGKFVVYPADGRTSWEGFSDATEPVERVAVGGSGKNERIAACSRDGSFVVFDLSTKTEILRQGPQQAWCISMLPDGQRVLVGYKNGTVKLISLEKAGNETILGQQNGPVSSMVYNDNQKLVFSLDKDNKLQYWHIPQTTISGGLF